MVPKCDGTHPMDMLPSGKDTDVSGLKIQIVTIVNGPSLPMYMIRTSNSLLKGLSPGVMPVDSPTVPKADVISSMMSSKGSPGSSTHMHRIPEITTRDDRAVTIAAL